MDSFTTWMLKGLLAKQETSRLSEISKIIDWHPIRQILEEMYDNKSEKGGRPNCDVIMMFKILIIQKWYGLSDLEVERQMADRISFMAFLGFPDPFPDSRTIWLFLSEYPAACCGDEHENRLKDHCILGIWLN